MSIFDIDGAFELGFSETAIAKALSSIAGFDYDAAMQRGRRYSDGGKLTDRDIIEYLRGSTRQGYDVGAALDATASFIKSTPPSILGAIGTLARDEDPYAEQNRFTEWERAAEQKTDEFRQRIEGKEHYPVIPGIATVEDVGTVADSVGHSLVGMGPSILGSVGSGLSNIAPTPQTKVAGKTLSTLGGMFGSAVTIGKIDAKAVGKQLIDAADMEMLAEEGRLLGPEERKALLDNTRELRNEHALWEAGPEAIGNAIEMIGWRKIISGIGKGKGLVSAVKKVVSGGATNLGTEYATETTTGVFQQPVEVELGLSEDKEKWSPTDPKAWKESFKEQLGPTTLLVGALGASAGGIGATGRLARAGADKISGRAPQKQSALIDQVPGEYKQLFVGAAQRHGVPLDFLISIAKNESSFNPRAESGTGPQGIMQISRGKQKDWGVKDPFDPVESVDVAAREIAKYMRAYDGDMDTVAAVYNQGEGYAKTWRDNADARSYVSKINRTMGDQAVLAGQRRDLAALEDYASALPARTEEMREQARDAGGDYRQRLIDAAGLTEPSEAEWQKALARKDDIVAPLGDLGTEAAVAAEQDSTPEGYTLGRDVAGTRYADVGVDPASTERMINEASFERNSGLGMPVTEANSTLAQQDALTEAQRIAEAQDDARRLYDEHDRATFTPAPGYAQTGTPVLPITGLGRPVTAEESVLARQTPEEYTPAQQRQARREDIEQAFKHTVLPDKIEQRLAVVERQMDQGETGSRWQLPDVYGDGGHVVEPGRWDGMKSTNPDWLKDKDSILHQVGKAGIETVIKKARAGEKMTPKQNDVWSKLLEVAEIEHENDPETGIARQYQEIYEKEGMTGGQPRRMFVGDLNTGDKVIIPGYNGPHLAEHRGYDNKGRAIIKDGVEVRAEPWDEIDVEDVKRGREGLDYMGRVNKPALVGDANTIVSERKAALDKRRAERNAQRENSPEWFHQAPAEAGKIEQARAFATDQQGRGEWAGKAVSDEAPKSALREEIRRLKERRARKSYPGTAAAGHTGDAQAFLRDQAGREQWAGKQAAETNPMTLRQRIEQRRKEKAAQLPPGYYSDESVTITNKGRKWLHGKRRGKDYEVKIAITKSNKDWAVGDVRNFPAHIETKKSRYGAATTVHPLTDAQAKAAKSVATVPEIKRWLGYVEEKAGEGYVYNNGVAKLNELGIKGFPEYQERLDAAIAKVEKVKSEKAQAKKEQKEKEGLDGKTYLSVPYKDKEIAKQNGARFDGERKKWYVVGKSIPDALKKYAPLQAEDGQHIIYRGSGYGGKQFTVGQTIRVNQKGLPEYVTVLRESREYLREDGMSFGVGDDSGYIYSAVVREATPEEAARVKERIAAKKAQDEAKSELKEIAREIQSNGSASERRGQPVGTSIDMPGNPQDAYGGGEWFVIGEERIWHVRNNGTDGGDWSQNNVRTSGAGAIGYSVKFNADLAQRLVGALEAAGARVPQSARDLISGPQPANDAPQTDLPPTDAPQTGDQPSASKAAQEQPARDVKFSKAVKADQEKNLYVAHNINARGLRHVLDLGGMPAPSLAVASVNGSPYTSFGDITLLANPDILVSSKAQVFDADVYSPRYPQPHNTISDKDFNELIVWAKDERHDFDPLDYSSVEEASDYSVLVRNDSIRYAWLRDQGQLPRMTRADGGMLRRALDRKFRNKKLEQGLEQWAIEKFKELVPGRRIFKGYTYSGNRRYVPYTMDNILKEMTAAPLRGGEGFNYGAGNIRAAFAKKFKGLADIQKDRGKIISKQEFGKIKEESQNKLFDLLEYLKPYYKFSADSFGYLNDASGAIAEGPRGLRETFDLDAEAQNKVNEFVSYLKGLPTEYFEAKLRRVVALNEFSTAVVPRGADKGLVERLKSLGLQVKFYKNNDSTDRLRVVRDAATLFSKANEPEAPRANVRQELESILGKLRTRKLLAGGRVTILKSQAEAKTLVARLGGKKLPVGDTSALESLPDSVVADAKHLADLIGTDTFFSETNGGVKTPVEAAQLRRMRRFVKNDEVGRVIIQSIPVDMMDFLSRGKASASESLHDDAMLRTLFPFNGDNPVSFSVDVSNGLASIVAGLAAKISESTTLDVARPALKDSSAVIANKKSPSLPALDGAVEDFRRRGSLVGNFENFPTLGASNISHNSSAGFVGRSIPQNATSKTFDDNDVEITAKFSKDGKIQGFYLNGKAYLVEDGIAEGDAMGVLMHEFGEHADQLGFKNNLEYRLILKSLEKRQNEQSATGEAIRAAMQRVPKDTAVEHQWSEVAAYLVENNADQGLSLVNRLVAFFKKWLYKAGAISADKLTHKDLAAFAYSAVRAEARRSGKVDNKANNIDNKPGLLASQQAEALESRAAKTNGLPMDFDSRMARAREMGFDTDTVFSHASWNDPVIERILAKDTTFDGLFAVEREESSHGGPHQHRFIVKTHFDHADLSRSLRNDDAPFKEVVKRELGEEPGTNEDWSLLEDLVLENESVHELWSDEDSVPTFFKEALGGYISGDLLADISWNVQKLRGKVAKEYGADAIDMTDEHGTSALLLPGSGVRSLKAAFDPSYVESDHLLRSMAEPLGVTPEQLQREYDAVVKRYKGTDQWLKAPNGKKSNLNKRQWVLVRTPRFKAWFGDWENDPDSASKVVDANGEPLVVYHATNEDFSEFSREVLGGSTGKNTDAKRALSMAKVGFWFSARDVSKDMGSPATMPVFLNIRQPLRTTFEKMWNGGRGRSGQDGYIVGDSEFNTTSYVALNPTQIKSATGNTGAFDGSNQDIRYSIASAATNTFTGAKGRLEQILENSPEWRDRWERFIYNFIDSNDPRTRVWKRAGSPTDSEMVALERLRGKKAAADQKEFHDEMVTPLLKKMKEGGLKEGDLEEYAHAMHTPERNERMRRVNAKRTLDSLLGEMTEAERREYDDQVELLRKGGKRDGWDTEDIQDSYLQMIDEIFDELAFREAEHRRAEQEYEDRVWTDEELEKATPERLRKRLDSVADRLEKSRKIKERWQKESIRFAGMTDAEAASIVKKWKAGKRFDVVESARKDMAEISAKTLAVLRESGDISQEEFEAMSIGYKYYVPLHRDGFQDTRPATGRMTGPTGKPFKVAKGSMSEVVSILGNVIRAHDTAISRKHKLSAGRALYEFALAYPEAGITVEKQEQQPTHDREGNVSMYTSQTEPVDGVFVKVDGKRHLLRFAVDERTPEGRTLGRMLDSIKDADTQVGSLMSMLHTVTRFLAMVNTSLSPEFIITNFSRDFQTAFVHLSQEDIDKPGLKKAIAKDIVPAIKGIWAAENGKKDSDMAKWYADFAKNGGKVGWMQGYESIRELEGKLKSEMDLYGEGMRAKKAREKVLRTIDAANTAIENGVRLATYKNLVDNGVSKQQAALISSSLTVDFTQRGKMGSQINALYMFANASIQGSVRVAHALAKSPRVRKIAGGIVMTGFSMQMLALTSGGDDDSGNPYVLGVPDHIRERSMLLMVPGAEGKFMRVPMAYGYNVFYNFGAEIANSLYMSIMGKKYNHGQGAMRVVSAALDSFNPINSATLLQTIAPTLVDPFVYVAENKAWHGGDLRPKQNPFGPKTPESQRAWKSTSPVFKGMAEGLSWVTGGDKYEGGLVDISPEVFELAWETATGSMGRFVTNTLSLPLSAAKGDLEANKVPFLRTVYGSWDERSISNRYYEAMEKAQTAKLRVDGAKTLKERRDAVRSQDYQLYKVAESTEKRIKRLRKVLRQKEASGDKKEAERLKKRIVDLQASVLARAN